MKTKWMFLGWLICVMIMPLHAQTFTDNFERETVGDLASQWEPVKGSAVIGELDGKKVLSVDRYIVVKPVVNGQTTDYLGNQFTIEFDAFFHDVSSVNRQYYIIHLWDGTGVYGKNDKHADPYLIYRHGITATGSYINRKKIESLAQLEKTWRHIKITYAQNTLKFFIDDHLIHNQPDLFYDPLMVSFSARNSSGASSGITNISITDQIEGVEEETTEEETEDGATNGQNLPYTFPEQDGEANQILQTDGNGTLNWVDYTSGNATNQGSSGLEAIDEGNGIGLRLAGSNPDTYGNIGEKAVDLSYATDYGEPRGATGLQSTAIGYNTTASGYSSVAMGKGTVASGMMSTAIGNGSIASGYSSVAMNEGTTASAGFSTAMGGNTSATGYASLSTGSNTRATGTIATTMGYETKAEAYLTLAIGSKNIGGGDPDVWRGIDPLFEIGNGGISNTEDPSNALTVLKNGNIGIGTHTPQAKLHIQDGTDANNSKGGYLIIGDKKKENIVFDNNEIIARNNVQPAILYLQSDGGDVYVGRAVVHSSDKRLKQDIENLSYGLNEILQLRPVSYHWKTNPNASNKSLGLIAQEVQPILKELITVNTNNDDNTLGVNYTELIPILIKAIQEQQNTIEQLQSKESQKDKDFTQLNERLKLLESFIVGSKTNHK